MGLWCFSSPAASTWPPQEDLPLQRQMDAVPGILDAHLRIKLRDLEEDAPVTGSGSGSSGAHTRIICYCATLSGNDARRSGVHLSPTSEQQRWASNARCSLRLYKR